jgi:hypothetical protein
MVIWYLIDRAVRAFSRTSGVHALTLADLGRQQVADDLLRLVLAFEGRADDLVIGPFHAVELQLAHRVKHF